MIRAKDLNVQRFLGVETLPDKLDTTIELILTRTQSEKKQDSFDANDFYFSKVVSILIAVSYIITLLVKGTPFDQNTIKKET